ncbi:MAG: hypothetical protein HWN67_10020 [Candidatus Helarchaeota archaeon]|nr:hypothetical protein [Candidatus Helarchaeota archaeon]
MEEINRSLEMFQYTYKSRPKIALIIESIKKELVALLGNLGIYVSICDLNGNIKYIDPELDHFYKYIQEYCKSNFEMMETGSFAIPIKSLIFFRISDKVMVVLSAKITNANRLVTFVCKIDKYKAILNHIVDRVKTVNFWDTQTTSNGLFKSFQDQMYANEIEELFTKANIFLDSSEFEQTLTILNTMKKVSEKLEDSPLNSYLDEVIQQIESRLKTLKKSGIIK